MSRFLRALSKMGLVEIDDDEMPPPRDPEPDVDLDDDDLMALLGRDEPEPTGPPAAPPPESPAPTEILEVARPASAGEAGQGDPTVREGRPFADVYAAADIGDSPFPAEKMLRVLDGLAAMDPATRKAAVLAMDSADDAWTIDDPLLDADRKTRALQGAQADLSRTLQAAQGRAEADTRSQDEAQAAAVEQIKQSIAELEQEMARVIEEATTRRADIRQQLEATRGAVARETARFAAEVERLALLRRTFGETGSN